MEKNDRRWARMGLGVLVSMVAVGCTSPEAYRQTIADRDAQIRVLREERASLKRERQGHLGRIDDLDTQLVEANARVVEVETPAGLLGDQRLGARRLVPATRGQHQVAHPVHRHQVTRQRLPQLEDVGWDAAHLIDLGTPPPLSGPDWPAD